MAVHVSTLSRLWQGKELISFEIVLLDKATIHDSFYSQGFSYIAMKIDTETFFISFFVP